MKNAGARRVCVASDWFLSIIGDYFLSFCFLLKSFISFSGFFEEKGVFFFGGSRTMRETIVRSVCTSDSDARLHVVLRSNLSSSCLYAGVVDNVAVWWGCARPHVVLVEPLHSCVLAGAAGNSLPCLSLELPCAISCAPVMRVLSSASDPFMLSAIVACIDGVLHAFRLHLTTQAVRHVCSISLSPARVAVLRFAEQIPDDSHDVHPNVLFGCVDGGCGLIDLDHDGDDRVSNYCLFADDLKLLSSRHADQHNVSDDASLLSGVSRGIDPDGDSAMSDRSFASQRSGQSTNSRGSILSRLLRMRHADSDANVYHPDSIHVPGKSDDNQGLRYPSPLAGFRAGFHSSGGSRARRRSDPVVDMCSIVLDHSVYHLSLTIAGVVQVFGLVPTASKYLLVAELKLPVKLAQGQPHALHVLKDGLFCVALIVDMDPHPHALSVYNIEMSVPPGATLSLTSTKVCQRNGPFDAVCDVVYDSQSNALVLATLNGRLSTISLPVRNSAFESAHVLGDRDAVGADTNCITAHGLDYSTVWSYIDDLVDPKGQWHVFDSLQKPLADRILIPNRFSLFAVARALRLSSPAESSFDFVVTALRDFLDKASFEDADRLISRAQRYAIMDDAPILGICHVSGSGVYVVRRTGVFVLRSSARLEASTLLCRGATPTTNHSVPDADGSCFKRIRRVVACNAVPQIASVQFSYADEHTNERAEFGCIISVLLQKSAKLHTTAIHELLPASALADSQLVKRTSILDLAELFTEQLKPGAFLLQFLASEREIHALREVTVITSDILPVSSLFALGLVSIGERRQCVDSASSVERVDDVDADGLLVSVQERSKKLLDDAFSSFVAASKVAAKALDSDSLEVKADLDCAFSLLNCEQAIAERADARAANVEHLHFWILERSRGLLNDLSAARHAAAIALEALSVAPDLELHEMMRAAAFSRFIDVRDFDCALKTILKAPPQGHSEPFSLLESAGAASALQDNLTVLVNTAIDNNKFSWLIQQDLSLPLKTIIADALKWRARSSEVLNRGDFVSEHGSSQQVIVNEEAVFRQSTDSTSVLYEYLVSWQLSMDAAQAAAGSAFEWADRISSEGLRMALDVAQDVRVKAQCNPLEVLLTWSRFKTRAYATSSAICRTLRPEIRYIPFRDIASSSKHPPEAESGCLALDVLSRLHLLSRAQAACLQKKLSAERDNKNASRSGNVDYIVAHAPHLLTSNERGLNYAISTLILPPMSWSDVQLALELASSWLQQGGSDIFMHAVKNATIMLFRDNTLNVDSVRLPITRLSQMLDMLGPILSSSDHFLGKNPYAAAAEGLLEVFGGSIGLPQWLIDAAAWGVLPADSSQALDAQEIATTRRMQGDATRLVHAYVRFNRPEEGLQTVISKVESTLQSGVEHSDSLQIPYSILDSAIRVMREVASDDDLMSQRVTEKLQHCIDMWTERKIANGGHVDDQNAVPSMP